MASLPSRARPAGERDDDWIGVEEQILTDESLDILHGHVMQARPLHA
jgi:hypothetical protein